MQYRSFAHWLQGQREFVQEKGGFQLPEAGGAFHSPG